MQVPEIPTLLSTLAVILGPTGAAWVGVRTALNGTRERVKQIDAGVEHLRMQMSDVRDRVSKIEGSLGL